MTFALRAELYYSDAWHDVSGDVRYEDGLTIARGRSNERSRPQPGTCQLVFSDSANGDYNPRSPLGSRYGLIGRNTPLRITNTSLLDRVLVSDTFTRSVTDGWGTSTSGHAWTLVGGTAAERDVDGSVGTVTVATDFGTERQQYVGHFLNCEVLTSVQMDQLPLAGITFQPKINFRYDSTTGRRFRVRLDIPSSGFCALTVLDRDGTTVGTSATMPFASTTARIKIRARLVGQTLSARAWLASGTEPTTWQLEVDLGADTDDNAGKGSSPVSGAVGVAAQISGTPAGAVVFKFDDLSITDPVGGVRMVGGVASWKPRRDTSGLHRTVEIEAGGILRRLGQGATPLRSALYRGITSPGRPAPVAYWSGEDGDDATSIAPAVGPHPMVIAGTPQMAAYTDLPASDALPKMGSAKFTGTIGRYAVTGETAVRMIVSIPASLGVTRTLFTVRCTGSARDWSIRVDTSGNLELRVLDDESASLYSSGFLAYGVNGTVFELKLQMVQNGSAIDWAFGTATISGGTLTFAETTGTLASNTVGRATKITVAPGQALTDVAFGHITVASDKDRWDGYHSALIAWQGETAGNRVARLCREEGVAFTPYGDLQNTETMGAQRVATLIDLLNDCADADGGILHETRYELGLTYRTRASLCNQDVATALLDRPTLTLDRSLGQLIAPFEPTEDDQATRNDVSVKRQGGSSARSVQESGPLNVNDPADDAEGVGRYDESVTLYIGSDARLDDHAGWRRHLGTWGEERFPRVAVQLAGLSASLVAAALAVESGDRTVVTNSPVAVHAGDIEQLAQGYAERFDQFSWVLTFNCAPAGAWAVFVLEDQVLGRLHTSGSELAAPVDSDDTVFLVATDSGKRLWITTASRSQDFPFAAQLGGEVVKVTAITGTTSPQEWTVQRALNSVVKSHPAGTRVQIARRAVS
jgi:hypothetical protein